MVERIDHVDPFPVFAPCQGDMGWEAEISLGAPTVVPDFAQLDKLINLLAQIQLQDAVWLHKDEPL